MTQPEELPTDEDIAQCVLGGELELFEILMRRHNQRIYRTVRPILRNEAEVEDVMQQAYVSACSNLQQFRASARFGTWLARIAVHEALCRSRRAKRRPALFEDDVALAEEPHMTASAQSDPRNLAANRELAALLERDRRAPGDLPPCVRAARSRGHDHDGDRGRTRRLGGCRQDAPPPREVHAPPSPGQLAESELGVLFPFRAQRCDRLVRAMMEEICRPTP